MAKEGVFDRFVHYCATMIYKRLRLHLERGLPVGFYSLPENGVRNGEEKSADRGPA